jgi:hypothetical protein
MIGKESGQTLFMKKLGNSCLQACPKVDDSKHLDPTSRIKMTKEQDLRFCVTFVRHSTGGIEFGYTEVSINAATTMSVTLICSTLT